MIHFQCPTCGASFDVADNLAGRTGRCKKCGERTKIPSPGGAVAAAALARASAAPAAGPRLTPIDVDSRRPQPSVIVGRPTNWLDAVTSQVALAPISVDGVKGIAAKRFPLDEPSIPGPYKLASAPSLPALHAARGKPAGAITRGYRGAMGKVQKVFRWLNESAYLVSVPFLMLVLLGLAVGDHSLMTLGAIGAVLLNIGRIVTGLANLVVIPFRESPLQGILFLIPPITFFYLAQNWHKVHRPVKRIIGPILTVALVGVAFLIEPALQAARTTEGSLKERAEAGVGTLKKEVRNQVRQVRDSDDLKVLQDKAQGALKSLNADDALRSIDGRLQDARKAIENQVPSPKSR
jgi:predicted Zn finger-like uncharacterized protein